MKLIQNAGGDRVIDELRRALTPPASLDLASPAFSLFAFAELRELLLSLDACRIVLPSADGVDLGLTGAEADRAPRNRLQVPWPARECATWITGRVEIRGTLPVCLANKVTAKEVEALGTGIAEWHQALAPAGDTRCVFRDSAFADDVAKTNLSAILEQHGLANVRSI